MAASRHCSHFVKGFWPTGVFWILEGTWGNSGLGPLLGFGRVRFNGRREVTENKSSCQDDRQRQCCQWGCFWFGDFWRWGTLSILFVQLMCWSAACYFLTVKITLWSENSHFVKAFHLWNKDQCDSLTQVHYFWLHHSLFHNMNFRACIPKTSQKRKFLGRKGCFLILSGRMNNCCGCLISMNVELSATNP